MASWWHPQQHQPIGEPFEYHHPASLPPPSQTMVPSPFYYDSQPIMIEGGNSDEYIIHPTNNGNMNDSNSIDYHHRRNWFNGTNNDDRKAKSRVAAKHRRSAENKEFTDLSKLLPLQQQIAAQLDKASIIRLTISYLRLHEFLSHGDPSWPNEINVPSRKQAFKLFNADEASQLLQSLDGFIFALSSDGRILYISESVSSSLGLSMVEMTGNFIFNYLHEDDKKVFADALGFELLPPSSPTTSLTMDLINSANNDADLLDLPPDQCPRMQAPIDSSRFNKKSLCVRMRSSLTKRAPNMKTPGYRSIQIIGEYRWLHPDYRRPSNNGDYVLGFVGTAIIPNLSPSQNEFPIPEHQNVIRLDENLHITHMDDKLQRTLNWNLTYATSSLYLYVHPDDLSSLSAVHRDLPSRQQLVLNVVRLQMNMMIPSSQNQRKANGNNNTPIIEQKWIWCDLLATMMQSKTNDENFVILVVEIIGVDDGLVVPTIDEELENEYATRISYRSEVSSDDVVESSSPTVPARVSIKQQRQQSPYTSEQQSQQGCFYPSPPPPPPPPPPPAPPSLPTSSFSSSSPHHRHLPSTSTSSSSPSSPHSPLPTSRPSVIMTKSMHHQQQQQQQQHYHPYRHYDCNTFVQQQYPLPTATTNEQWYYPPTNTGGDNMPLYRHPHHHSS
ncbi:unnamed protein product [Rotaria magnacalcarata]|uniref:Uncharacterized protein n=6 Tax=Rotaria magnacalcarata TaxID=392030 RepID=A0A814R5P2_9BILA|nr:unnamed protein product [Rotaria magnacalcarata]CAF1629016.1 unnamed protein product [Rotaria magnacalcarata]CAF2259103.1 unnamed protein product [Rotaria magnacalcarata]